MQSSLVIWSPRNPLHQNRKKKFYLVSSNYLSDSLCVYLLKLLSHVLLHYHPQFQEAVLWITWRACGEQLSGILKKMFYGQPRPPTPSKKIIIFQRHISLGVFLGLLANLCTISLFNLENFCNQIEVNLAQNANKIVFYFLKGYENRFCLKKLVFLKKKLFFQNRVQVAIKW